MNRFPFRWLSLLTIATLLATGLLAPVGGLAGDNVQARTKSLVLRVYFTDAAERDQLAVELGAIEADTRGGYLTLWTDQAQYDELVARGLRVEIDAKLTEEANRPIEWNKDTFYGGYFTVDEIYQFLDQKVAQYPTLVEKIDIGDSWCKTHAPCILTSPTLQWNGFDLYVLRITNQAITGTKPVFWFDAAIHSREIATPELAMRYIDWLLGGYNTNADARWLVDYHDIYVMPTLNPDGHFMVEYGNNNPILQRKNADYDDGCTVWGGGSSQLGTDLNRNYSFLWGCCGGSSGSSCSQTYRGPSAGSEEETQAAMAKIAEVIPDQRGPLNTDPAPITTTGIIQNMHTVAELNLYPWGWTGAAAPNGTDLANIGQHMSALNAGPPGNGYTSCQPPNCLYAVDGDSVDWAYGVLGVPAYTTELSGGSFFPSYTQIPAIWDENRGMLIHLAKIARTPYLLTRGPDTNLAAANPMTVTQGTPISLTATINYVWSGNQYMQNVADAEYYVDTPPWAGGAPLAMTASDGAYDEQTEPVEATLDTAALAPGQHIVFMRGRGINDYQGFQSWGAVSAVFVWVEPGGGTPTPTATPTATPAPTETPTPTATTPVQQERLFLPAVLWLAPNR